MATLCIVQAKWVRCSSIPLKSFKPSFSITSWFDPTFKFPRCLRLPKPIGTHLWIDPSCPPSNVRVIEIPKKWHFTLAGLPEFCKDAGFRRPSFWPLRDDHGWLWIFWYCPVVRGFKVGWGRSWGHYKCTEYSYKTCSVVSSPSSQYQAGWATMLTVNRIQ